MRRLIYTLFLLFVGSVVVFSQKDQDDPYRIFDDAEYFYSSGDYQEASFLFLKLIKLQPDNANFNFRTGMTFLNIPGQEIKAIPYLEKAVLNTSLQYKIKNLEETNAPHHAWFYLGNAYRINNELDKALECYTRFKSLKDFEKKYNTRIVDTEIKACERAKIIKDSPLNLMKTNLGSLINTSNSDYSPVLSLDENTMVYMNSQKFYEAILFSKKTDGVWSNPVNITQQVGSDGDMTPTSLSADGLELYLVKKDNNKSDIYVSRFDGNLWNTAIPVNKNINSRSAETFASLSPDGKNLYFTSDRKGGYGGLDIYVSKKQSVGDWGPAENLGSLINTELDEETPYISGDGKTLFYSSKGRFNMGGFDVFYSTLNKFNVFDEGINLGYPVNTTGDNMGYFPVKDGKTGYMALFEDNSLGQKDIYKLEILPSIAPPVSASPIFNRNFTISVSDSESGEIIDIIYDDSSNQFKAVSSGGRSLKVSVKDE